MAEQHRPGRNEGHKSGATIAPTKSVEAVLGEFMAMGYDPNSKKNSTGADYVTTTHNDTYDFIKPEQFNMVGRAVLITGASKGLGRARAISYAKAGASYIAIGARSSLEKVEIEIQEAAKKAGRASSEILAMHLDVTSQESVAQAAQRTEKTFRRLDILINNSGYMEEFVKVTEVKPNDWWRGFEVNVFGVFLMTRAFIALLLKRQDGLKTMLNMTSISAHTKCVGGSAYQMSKLAICRFSELCMAEYGDQGLLSFNMHPGSVKTDLAMKMPSNITQLLIHTPELSADTAVWLTVERREWLAGRYIVAPWDIKEFHEKKDRVVREDHLKMRMNVGLD